MGGARHDRRGGCTLRDASRHLRRALGSADLELQLATASGGHLPSHHTLNTVIRAGDAPGTAVAWSRYVLVTYEASAAGGDYLDTLEERDGTWVITSRRVTERNRQRPDGEYSAAGAGTFDSFEAFEAGR